MVRLGRLLQLCICGRIRGFSAGWVLDRTTRQLDGFMGDFAGGRFYLFGRRAFRAVRAVRLFCAVIQLLYKILYHLALDNGCSLMFRLLVFWTVVSFSNIWNGSHLRILSQVGTDYRFSPGVVVINLYSSVSLGMVLTKGTMLPPMRSRP